ERCGAETDILGEYGFCPRCGLTNGRQLFAERMDKMLARIVGTQNAFPENTPAHRKARGEVWEELVKASVSDFESFAKRLRAKLLLFPMTARRRKHLEKVNFQAPLMANQDLKNWFDIGFFEWPGDKVRPAILYKMVRRGLTVRKTNFGVGLAITAVMASYVP